MGVRRLEKYMEKTSGCCIPVDIKQLIETYRKETNEKPVIVLNIFSCFKYFFKYFNLAWIGGGQLKELNDVVETFFKNFQDLGAELVVFTDGVCVPSKEKQWVIRQRERQETIQELFDQLHANSEGGANLIDTPRMTQVVVRIATLKCKIKCIRSILACDFEVARYAEQNNCFAILGQDTDYVIFKGARHYLSLKHLDLSNMTTWIYDRNKLAASLKLSVDELPLLATLIGHDIVDEDLLLPFHQGLQDLRRRYDGGSRYINVDDNYPNVAKFIKRSCENFNNILPRISLLVFKDKNNVDLLRESLNFFNVHYPHNDDQIDKSITDEKWLGVLKCTRERHISNKVGTWVYSVVYFSLFRIGCSFEDYKRKHFPPVHELCQKLLQKIYGILLLEKPVVGDETHQVKQLVLAGPDSINGCQTIDAIHPDSHSGLEALWSSETNLGKERLDLFFWALGIDNLTLSDVHLIIPMSTLKYLMAEGFKLHDWELNALICSMVLLDYYTVEQLREIPEFPLETRPVNLYSLFSKCSCLVIFLNHACGYPIDPDSENPIRYIDGKLFQQKYRDAKALQPIEQLCDEKESCIKTVKTLMQLIHLQ